MVSNFNIWFSIPPAEVKFKKWAKVKALSELRSQGKWIKVILLAPAASASALSLRGAFWRSNLKDPIIISHPHWSLFKRGHGGRVANNDLFQLCFILHWDDIILHIYQPIQIKWHNLEHLVKSTGNCKSFSGELRGHFSCSTEEDRKVNNYFQSKHHLNGRCWCNAIWRSTPGLAPIACTCLTRWRCASQVAPGGKPCQTDYPQTPANHQPWLIYTSGGPGPRIKV